MTQVTFRRGQTPAVLEGGGSCCGENREKGGLSLHLSPPAVPRHSLPGRDVEPIGGHPGMGMKGFHTRNPSD